MAESMSEVSFDDGPKQPYHLVKPSPWPLVATMAVWWRDIIHESVVEKAHSPAVKIGLRYGMALFIASEVMFFVAFFWAYYSAALYPPAVFGGVWPPNNIKETVDPFDMPFMMTLILLLS